MVQIEATLFPLHDPTPQTFIANPMLATATDDQKATVTILPSDIDRAARSGCRSRPEALGAGREGEAVLGCGPAVSFAGAGVWRRRSAELSHV